MNDILDKISNNNLWIQKYSPKTFDDLILHPVTKKKLVYYIKREVKHTIFVGKSGSGKSVTANILARMLIPKEHIQKVFLDINASDDRGLNLINNILIPFIKKKINNFKFKLVLISEANTITPKAQNQIATLMDTNQNCKFLFVTSDLSDISDTIQSRCSILFFPLLSSDDVYIKLKNISKKENINIDDNSIKAIISITQRDLRQAINFLQVINFIKEKITPELIYELFDKPNVITIKNLLLNLKNKNRNDTLNIIKILKKKGYSPNDVLLAILNFVLEQKKFIDLEKEFLIKVYQITSKYYIRINQGNETWIQVHGCMAEIFNI